MKYFHIKSKRRKEYTHAQHITTFCKVLEKLKQIFLSTKTHRRCQRKRQHQKSVEVGGRGEKSLHSRNIRATFLDGKKNICIYHMQGKIY